MSFLLTNGFEFTQMEPAPVSKKEQAAKRKAAQNEQKEAEKRAKVRFSGSFGSLFDTLCSV